MSYYFAYGSNMNPQRMAERALQVVEVYPAWLDGFGLRFNKRSRRDAQLACANIAYARGERVEGVLYRLATPDEIAKLDPHEGTPYMYSRDMFPVQTLSGVIPAWTYIANPAVIDNSILPARWYVEHLLAGREFLSAEYLQRIDRTRCREDVNVVW
ncbi:MAG: gamma-glutamylcyclotransferase [Gammaproteobacteria bacterium]|nr:MAG: gamma-glutamylcyclotransferase [Gammaproteobacteria bacterium]